MPDQRTHRLRLFPQSEILSICSLCMDLAIICCTCDQRFCLSCASRHGKLEAGPAREEYARKLGALGLKLMDDGGVRLIQEAPNA